jgi:hypothetical protein
MLIEHHPNYLN